MGVAEGRKGKVVSLKRNKIHFAARSKATLHFSAPSHQFIFLLSFSLPVYVLFVSEPCYNIGEHISAGRYSSNARVPGSLSNHTRSKIRE